MRLFICDPVCVQPFGHNAIALSVFKRAFEAYSDNVITLCCKYLPKDLVEKYGFTPFYEFYYHDYMNVPNAAPAPGQSKAGIISDDLEALATADAEQLIKTYSIDENDTIIFPSVDFYGAVGLLNALAKMPLNRTPRLLIRFIGVMENASKLYRNPQGELLGRIGDGLYRGVRMKFSAETPKLADWLSEKLEADVLATPHPDVPEALPMPEFGPFEVYCPGSARSDKGFFELNNIFRAVRSQDREFDIRLATQTMPARDAVYQQNYISALYAIPGVELLPGMITDEQMLERFRRSCLVVLPYDREIYHYRGSAAMSEAACLGRPVITLRGTAFADQVEWYGLGTVVAQPSDMAEAIMSYSKVPREKLEFRARRARRKFLADAEYAYRTWQE